MSVTVINIRTSKNITPYHLISASVIVDIIKLILEKKRSDNVTDTDYFTPLHV